MEHNYDDFYYTGESGEAFDSKEIGQTHTPCAKNEAHQPDQAG